MAGSSLPWSEVSSFSCSTKPCVDARLSIRHRVPRLWCYVQPVAPLSLFPFPHLVSLVGWVTRSIRWDTVYGLSDAVLLSAAGTFRTLTIARSSPFSTSRCLIYEAVFATSLLWCSLRVVRIGSVVDGSPIWVESRSTNGLTETSTIESSIVVDAARISAIIITTWVARAYESYLSM